MSSSVLSLKKSNCKNCYKCIRNCPVKSIRFSNNQANIVADECILCGMCFVVCPQNAKQVRNDVPTVQQMLASGKRVIASVAPSFIAEFPMQGFEAMRQALKQIGFYDAQETAIGATIVKKEYERMIAQREKSVIISSCCHTVNTLIQKHFPGALPSLAGVLSPMLAHCRAIKQEDPEALTVFIGPCISKKEEADLYGITVAGRTFVELESLLNESGVTLPELGPDPEEGKRARFFPIEGGIIRSMDIENTGYHYMAVTGVENCMAALREIESGTLENCFVELSACEGSCINGPGIRHHHIASTLRSETKVDTFAGPADFETPAPFELEKPMNFIGVHKQMPGERAIREILAQMGKTTPEQELNCGCCGYNTCREKAIVGYQGLSDLSLCLPVLKEKAETFSGYVINSSPNGIFVLDEDLCVQQINRAACQLFNLKSPNDIVGSPIVRILNPSDYLSAMTTGVPVREKKHFLAEYNKYVAETIVYDKEYHIIFSIMRDITREEEQETARTQLQTKTVEITNQVIEKQMRVVQEIASLLGETTAETKIALTQLKDTLQN